MLINLFVQHRNNRSNSLSYLMDLQIYLLILLSLHNKLIDLLIHLFIQLVVMDVRTKRIDHIPSFHNKLIELLINFFIQLVVKDVSTKRIDYILSLLNKLIDLFIHIFIQLVVIDVRNKRFYYFSGLIDLLIHLFIQLVVMDVSTKRIDHIPSLQSSPNSVPPDIGTKQQCVYISTTTRVDSNSDQQINCLLKQQPD